MENLWKFLTINQSHEVVSINGNNEKPWDLFGRPKTIPGVPVLCKSGYHASKTIADAATYCNGPILAKMTGTGSFASQGDKFAFQNMSIDNAWMVTPDVLYTLVKEFAQAIGSTSVAPIRGEIGLEDTTYNFVLAASEMTSNTCREKLVYSLFYKLSYKNCYDVIGDIAAIAAARNMPNFLNEFFLNHVISERSYQLDGEFEIDDAFDNEPFLKD